MVGLKLASVNYPGDRKAESVNGFTGRLAPPLCSRLTRDYGLLRIWTLERKVNFSNSYAFLSICRNWLKKGAATVGIWMPGGADLQAVFVWLQMTKGQLSACIGAAVGVGFPSVRGDARPFRKVCQICWATEAPFRRSQGGGSLTRPFLAGAEFMVSISFLQSVVFILVGAVHQFYRMTAKENAHFLNYLPCFVNSCYFHVDLF